MLEADVENILARHPQIIEPGLVLIARQYCINGKRVDLLFADANGRKLVVEVKVGSLCRADIGQLSEYCHYILRLDGVRPRGMLVGMRVTDEIRGAAGFNGFECLALPLAKLEQHAIERGDQGMLNLVRGSPASPSDGTLDGVAPPHVLQASRWPVPATGSAAPATGAASPLLARNKPSIADMLRLVLAGVEPGTLMNGHAIISAVLEKFPGQTTRASILLSDKCYNITNAGLSANYDFRIFESVGRGIYKYLGEGYPYSGYVTWKRERCGRWTEGVLEKWQNWPELAVTRGRRPGNSSSSGVISA